jgi:hypothetical protein
MNFLQRRKILKHTNFLDLHPVRLLNHEHREDGGIDLLLPRFNNTLQEKLFGPRKKDPFIRIRFDRTGTLSWLLIDGQSAVAEICRELAVQLVREGLDAGNVEERTAQFYSLLYRERYITFTELQDESHLGAK